MDCNEYRMRDLPIVLQYNDKYDKTDWDTLVGLCADNDVEALYEVGARLYIGEGVDEDQEKAVEYLEKVLNYQKHVGALFKIGVYYNSSEEPEQERKCFDYFMIGSECGDKKCTRELALLYRYGTIVEKNIEKAKELFLKAIEQGDFYAYCCLGEIYSSEDRDSEAFECFQKAYANTEDLQKSKSAYRIGQSYYHGWGVPQDSEKALPYLLEASEDGFDEVNGMLVCIYAYGETGEQSIEKALHYLNNVIEQERPNALFICGDALLSENRAEEAMPYIQEAANLGYEDAKNIIDQVSTDRNYLTERAEGGSVEAMVQLSKLLMGQGNGAAFAESFSWAEKAYSLNQDSPKVMIRYCLATGMDAHVKKKIGAIDVAYDQFKRVLSVIDKLNKTDASAAAVVNDMNYVYYDAGQCAFSLGYKDEALPLLEKADIERYPYAVVLIMSLHFMQSADVREDANKLWRVMNSDRFEDDFQKAHAHMMASYYYRMNGDLSKAYEQCKIAYSLDTEIAKDELSHYSTGLFGKVKYN